MTNLKIRSLTTAVTLCSGAIWLSACSSVNDAWSSLVNDNDPSLRTPTGYYEHATAKELADPLDVPNVLSKPYTDHSLDIPNITPSSTSVGLIGENMDVRPPVVSQIGTFGVDLIKEDKSVIVWFMPHNNLNINDVTQAWNEVNLALDQLSISKDQVDDFHYSIVTSSRDYNISGEPYDSISEDIGALRYKQAYQVEVGSVSNGQVGINITLLESNTFDSDGDPLEDELNQRQKSSFMVGFANNLLQKIYQNSQPTELVPEDILITLERDNNDQDAIMVTAPYAATWDVLQGVLSNYSFSIDKYSVSRSMFNVEYDEEDPEYYQALGVSSFGLESDDYIVRVGVSGEQKVAITFYTKKDKPLDTAAVARLYPAFSQALSLEFAKYKREGATNYIAKLSQ